MELPRDSGGAGWNDPFNQRREVTDCDNCAACMAATLARVMPSGDCDILRRGKIRMLGRLLIMPLDDVTRHIPPAVDVAGDSACCAVIRGPWYPMHSLTALDGCVLDTVWDIHRALPFTLCSKLTLICFRHGLKQMARLHRNKSLTMDGDLRFAPRHETCSSASLPQLQLAQFRVSMSREANTEPPRTKTFRVG